MTKVKSDVTDRFFSLVRCVESGCWEWQGGLTEKGYGIFYGPKKVRSHRFSWTIHHGEIPDRLHVLHRCDNRSCVNPAHLFLGTNDDNVRDCVLKGRRGKKMDAPKVMEMRTLYAQGMTVKELSKKYGISFYAARDIIRRKVWVHI